jgi:hypothetical protein
MRLNSKTLGAAFHGIAVAAAMMVTPAFAQAPPPEAPIPPPPAQGGPLGGPPPNGPPGAAKGGFATANVNLRSGPGTDAEIITTIPAGSRIGIASCDGEWCAVTWNGRNGFATARNIDSSPRSARPYRPQPGYAAGPPVYEAGPPVVYGAPAYYGPPAVVYGPGYYGYGPRYYGRAWGWRRRW